MFRYLMPKDGPVIEGLESKEVVYAKNQPEYLPLRTLVSKGPEGRVISRWTFSPEQRKAIADGEDIFVMLLTFTQALQPIQIATGHGKEDIGWVKHMWLNDYTVDPKEDSEEWARLLGTPATSEKIIPDWDRDTGNGFNERGYDAGNGTYHDPMG